MPRWQEELMGIFSAVVTAILLAIGGVLDLLDIPYASLFYQFAFVVVIFIACMVVYDHFKGLGKPPVGLWLIFLLPVAYGVGAIVAYDQGLKDAHPQVVLEDSDCAIFMARMEEFGAEPTEMDCANLPPLLQVTFPRSYNGHGWEEIYEGLQADFLSPEGGLPTFNNMTEAYASAKVAEEMQVLQVRSKDLEAMVLVAVGIFVFGSLIASGLSFTKLRLDTTLIIGILGVIVAVSGWWAWFKGGFLIPDLQSAAEGYCYSIFVSAAVFQAFVGSGLVKAIAEALTKSSAAALKTRKSGSVAIGMGLAVIGAFFSVPNLWGIVTLLTFPTIIAETPTLTMTAVGWSLILGTVVGVGVSFLLGLILNAAKE